MREQPDREQLGRRRAAGDIVIVKPARAPLWTRIEYRALRAVRRRMRPWLVGVVYGVVGTGLFVWSTHGIPVSPKATVLNVWSAIEVPAAAMFWWVAVLLLREEVIPLRLAALEARYQPGALPGSGATAPPAAREKRPDD